MIVRSCLTTCYVAAANTVLCTTNTITTYDDDYGDNWFIVLIRNQEAFLWHNFFRENQGKKEVYHS